MDVNTRFLKAKLSDTGMPSFRIFIIFVACVLLFSSQIFHAQAVSSSESELKIFIAGDIMLDRYIYDKARRRNDFNYTFSLLEPELKKFDLRIANLEGPITGSPSVATDKNVLRFTFNKKFLPALKRNFDALSLSNNHTNNFGEKGIDDTKKSLRESNIRYFGDPYNRNGVRGTIIEKNGFKIATIGYHELISPNVGPILKEIQELRKKSDYLVVMPHWGAEYRKSPSEKQKRLARLFIDAGADIVAGTHPHVIQTKEEYKGKKIYYSLGNFIFDQYFSSDTMSGLGIGIELKKENSAVKQSIKEYTVKMHKDGRSLVNLIK